MIRDADANTGGNVQFKSSQRLPYVNDTNIMRRTTRDVQSTFMQIEQELQQNLHTVC